MSLKYVCWKLLSLLVLGQTIEYSANDFVITPFGKWLKECVHIVEPGSQIMNDNDEYFTIIHDKYNIYEKKQRCSASNPQWKSLHNDNIEPAFGEGWQAYLQQDIGQQAATKIDSFLGNWTVPALPTKATDIEVLYTFTALQNNDWVPPEIPPFEAFDIIQPVLGYGKRSATGGGAFWSIASWYVSLSNDVIQSKIIQVKPGDIIFGNMTKIDNNGTWYIDSTNINTGEHTDFTISRSILSAQQYLFVTLEVYDIWGCNDYPLGSNIPYKNLYATSDGQPMDFKWSVFSNPVTKPICNESIVVENNQGSQATIYF